MVQKLARQSQVVRSQSKVKTGCTTCRIRKIKCDEQKPSCRRCVGTGRICDGYQNLFQVVTASSLKIAVPCNEQVSDPDLRLISNEDIELLSHSLSAKTLFDGVKLCCDAEVGEILMASLTDAFVMHAVSSLKALRRNLRRRENGFPFILQKNPTYTYGIQQYNLALKGSVSGPSVLNRKQLKSILLCCQIFISIEQVQSNYSVMAQHILGGLSILRDFRSGELTDLNDSSQEVRMTLPPLDIFVIKLFAAPCKFLDPPAINGQEDSQAPLKSRSYSDPPTDFGGPYADMCDARRRLKAIAFSAIDLLQKPPLNQKENDTVLHYGVPSLLQKLDLWIRECESLQKNVSSPSHASLSISFMYFLYTILQVVLLGRLTSSPDIQAMIETKGKLMQTVADDICGKIGPGN